MAKFGPSGNDDIFIQQNKERTEAPQFLSGLGLTAFEISFGRGINIKEETAKLMAENAKKLGIEISVHAPYYINLANNDLFDSNLMHIKESIKAVKMLGGNRVVVHCGSQGTLTRETAIELTKQNLLKVLKKINLEKEGIYLCLETMGRYKSIGNLEEINQLVSLNDRLIPCLDIGHLNCLAQGQIDYGYIFKNALKLEYAHMHFSKIRFNAKGEMNHLTFESTEFGPEPEEFIKALKQTNFKGTIICESKGTQARDAVILKKLYEYK
ncbi:MAG: TIM barrel protein [Firmicutes bacterium]|nr:TIM barrel protein [Bacillota bacterium]